MPSNVSITGDDALTLDLVGQYTYCPRRFHLMYVEGRWADNEYTVEGLAEGLDPWWGFYHQPRHGRPSLALDVMEPFRPAIVDSAVISAINTGMVQQSSFDVGPGACILKPEGRKAFIRAYDGRLDQLITHPVFDYRCSWRVVLRLQARLLARWLRGEIPAYTSVTTR